MLEPHGLHSPKVRPYHGYTILKNALAVTKTNKKFLGTGIFNFGRYIMQTALGEEMP